jgi:peptidoglycan/LPS O-acetylase OafA/YrhL
MAIQVNSSIQSAVKAVKRLHYLDHLKVVLTVLVIAHHASQAYAPLSGDWLISNPTKSAALMPFQTVNAAFFMGLFFLISGYFVPGAYDRKSAGDRKGTGAFLKTRLIRLAIPAFLFAVFVFGPTIYFVMGDQAPLTEFIKQLYQGGWQLLYIHLWFLLHLLVYNVGYALWRLITKRFDLRAHSNGKIPWHTVLLVFTLFLVLITWVVRFRYTINQWVPFLYLVPAEMAHLPQYISMFVLGILAYRFKALDRLPTAVGMIWLGIGVASATWLYVDYLSGESFMMSQQISGKNVGSLVWSAWEALTCVGLGVGLLTVFRDWINKPAGRMMSAITRAQYGAYIIHILVVIGAQAGLADLPLSPFIKFVIATIFGAIFSFGISHLALKIPGVKRII